MTKTILIILIVPFFLIAQNNENILDGTWDIISLDYSAELDLSFLEGILGFNPGVQDINGEADDAGFWTFQHPEYTYNNNLNFTTEPITILGFEGPAIPINVESSGSWSLINNDNTIATTDSFSGLSSDYDIDVLFEEFAILTGTVPFSQNIMGYDINLELEVELQLQKQALSSINDGLYNEKELILIYDLNGKTFHQKGFNILIYSDGTYNKRFIID